MSVSIARLARFGSYIVGVLKFIIRDVRISFNECRWMRYTLYISLVRPYNLNFETSYSTIMLLNDYDSKLLFRTLWHLIYGNSRKNVPCCSILCCIPDWSVVNDNSNFSSYVLYYRILWHSSYSKFTAKMNNSTTQNGVTFGGVYQFVKEIDYFIAIYSS